MQRYKHKEAFEAFIESRLSTYGTMAVAILASTAVSPAQAAIIVWEPIGLSTGANNSIYFNMVSGSANISSNAVNMDFRLRHSSNGFGSTFTKSARAFGVNPGAEVLTSNFQSGRAQRLSASQFISTDEPFARGALLGSIRVSSSGSSINGQFGSGGRGFVGLKFQIAGMVHLGWADITVDPNNMQITLNRFAYNDVAGEDIHVTDPNGVPEPSSTLLLAMGAVGLAAYRRKKKAA